MAGVRRSFVNSRLALVVAAMLLGGSAVFGSVITLSLVNPGSNSVTAGAPVNLEVRGTFDTRLSAVSFRLNATGAGGAMMTDRSLNPTGTNGLTYVSRTSQSPFASGLPHNLKTLALIEAAYDADVGGVPGSVLDGVPAGTDVLIEQITVVPSGSGSVTINLTNVSAAHTTTSPDGTLFDVAGVGVGSLVLTLVAPTGDGDGDHDVDLADYRDLSECLTGPGPGPIGAGCAAFNLDPDTDIDLRDVAGFQRVFGSNP
ncbi:MAG: hypothetical protein HY763_08880 [Planctomycetes bacterium]|nr:hypothetical protein [Planctomycetota bacterium]